MLKPPCSATETRSNIEIALIASLDMKLSNKQITKTIITLCGCAGWSAPLLFAITGQAFSCRGPYELLFLYLGAICTFNLSILFFYIIQFT